jgi:hypothetical protein
MKSRVKSAVLKSIAKRNFEANVENLDDGDFETWVYIKRYVTQTPSLGSTTSSVANDKRALINSNWMPP